LITPDAPYDRFVRGDASALNPSQLRGMALFESVGCVLCHRGPSFSDAGLIGGETALRIFPANATTYEKKYDLLLDGKRGTWRIASLRNVAMTGPWLHNGSVAKLEEVVRIMASAQLGRSGKLNAWLNDDRQLGKADRSPIGDAEVADLVAFLEALSSDRLVAEAQKTAR
jgi:cytochrome c peroxidase